MNNFFTTENTIFLIFILLVLIQIYINYFFKDNNTVVVKEEMAEIEVPLYKQLGSPSNVINGKQGRIYTWEIENPQPWNVIVYIENDEYPYKFSFKYNLNNYKSKIKKWNKIIPNMSYNNNLLLIPSKDENSALVILNLLLKNIMDELNFNDIIENDLITKSLTKINNFKVIRTKIIEQIHKFLATNPIKEMSHFVFVYSY